MEFMLNIESIHDITSKAYSDSPNSFWSGPGGFAGPSDTNRVPIRVNVNERESRLTVTYFTQQNVSAFVSHAMCGLFRRFSLLMFNISATVTQRTAKGQYVFLLSLDEKKTTKERTNCESEQNFDYFQYRNSMSNEPQKLFMSVQTFSRAFPFHFICDTDLRLVQIGSGMGNVFNKKKNF